jgi:hypothetical protein
MPSLLGKKNLDQVTEYEKPGRVAGTSTISISDIMESRKSIPVLSNNSELGKIQISTCFREKQEINLLLGQKELEFQKTTSSASTCTSTANYQSPTASV